jgi:hypothetical protein
LHLYTISALCPSSHLPEVEDGDRVASAIDIEVLQASFDIAPLIQSDNQGS